MAIGGTLTLKVNGEVQWATGDWEYTLGLPKRMPAMATFGLVGFTEEPTPATLKGKIYDRSGFDLAAMHKLKDATIQVDLANGKSIVFRNAFASGDWNVAAKAAEITCEFTAELAEEITA